MERQLRRLELFQGLDDGQLAQLAAVAKLRSLNRGEYLFLLGERADRLYVVLDGALEVCFPLAVDSTITDVPLESRLKGSLCGWSALVSPYRFTLSARAAAPAKVAAFSRQALLDTFESSPQVAYVIMKRVTDVIGHRLHRMRALWAREFQRSIASAGPASALRAESGREADGAPR